MPSNPKFPPSAEIKRAIVATIRAGFDIGVIEIHPDKIVIHRSEKHAPEITAYDIWKMDDGNDTDRLRHTEHESEALVGKSKS
jgi:hypothetical protein